MMNVKSYFARIGKGALQPLDEQQKFMISFSAVMSAISALAFMIARTSFTLQTIGRFFISHRILIPIICIAALILLVARKFKIIVPAIVIASLGLMALLSGSIIKSMHGPIDQMACSEAAFIAVCVFCIILSIFHAKIMKYAPGVIAVSVLVFVAADVLFSILTGLPEFPNVGAEGGIFYMVMKCGLYLTILLSIGGVLRGDDADADVGDTF